MTMAIRLMMMPVLTISCIFKWPDAKTIALGGVAIGIMNAMDADKVTGSINNNGFRLIALAIEATKGSSISAVAVLEVTSVRNTTIAEMAAMSEKTLASCKPANCWPINSDRPLAVKPLAKAKPPPKSKTIFQGSSLIVSTSAIFLNFVWFFVGMANSSRAEAMATVPSLIRLACSSRRDQPGIMKSPMMISMIQLIGKIFEIDGDNIFGPNWREEAKKLKRDLEKKRGEKPRKSRKSQKKK